MSATQSGQTGGRLQKMFKEIWGVQQVSDESRLKRPGGLGGSRECIEGGPQDQSMYARREYGHKFKANLAAVCKRCSRKFGRGPASLRRKSAQASRRSRGSRECIEGGPQDQSMYARLEYGHKFKANLAAVCKRRARKFARCPASLRRKSGQASRRSRGSRECIEGGPQDQSTCWVFLKDKWLKVLSWKVQIVFMFRPQPTASGGFINFPMAF